VETVQTGNASATDYTATETGGETKTESQGYVNRTKTEVIETALNKTGAVVQQKFSQGMQEARVAVDKVRLPVICTRRWAQTVVLCN
jgi:hypothetical protein